MMRVVVVVCLLASGLGVSAHAEGQIATGGSMRGHVKDEQDAVLSGVRLAATSRHVPGTYEVLSDGEGYYRLLDLPPGEYTLTAELDGFAKWVREAVIVRAGLNINVPVVMQLGDLNEVVEVRSETPTLEISRPSQSLNVSGDLQRALPTTTKRLWTDALHLAPGVVHTAGIGLFYVHGSSQDSHVLQVDGMDVMSSRQNNPLYFTLNSDAISDVEIKTAAVEASAPLGTGAVVNVASTSGTDRFEGATWLVRQPLAWSDSNDPRGRPGKLDVWQYDAAAGGPMRRGHDWFFGSFRYVKHTNAIARSADQLALLRALTSGFEPFPSTERGPAIFAKTTHRLSARHQLLGLVSYDYYRQSTVDPTVDGSYVWSRTGGPVAGARLTSAWRSSLLTRFLASHNAKGIVTGPLRNDITGVRVHERAFLSAGRLTGTGALATLANTANPAFEEPSSRTTIAGDLLIYKNWLGSAHEFQTGFYWLPWIQQDQITSYRDDGTLLDEAIFRDPANPSAGLITFHRQIYDQPEVRTGRLRSRDVAAYIQDRWTPLSRVTVSAGVRIDWVKRTDTLFDRVTQVSTDVGPRVGVNVALTPSARHVARASWNRVHENLTAIRLTAGTYLAGFRDLYDNDLNGTFETALVTPGRTQVASDRVIDPDYHQAFVQEWTAGYGSQWPGHVTVDVGVTRRAYRDRAVGIESNGIYDGGVFRGYRDESLNQIRFITNNRWNSPLYTGLHTRLSRQGRRLQLLASWSRQWREMDGTWEPNEAAALLQPDAFANDRGIGDIRGNLNADNYGVGNTFGGLMWRDHLIQAGASLQLPWDVQVAAHYMVQSGHWSGPILTRAAAPDPAVGPPIVQLSNGRLVSNPLATTLRFAYPTRGEGQFRSPEMRTLNLRIAHERRFGTRVVRFSADLFNATNSDADLTTTFGAANLTFSPLYRTTSMRVAPRSVQVTAGVRF